MSPYLVETTHNSENASPQQLIVDFVNYQQPAEDPQQAVNVNPQPVNVVASVVQGSSPSVRNLPLYTSPSHTNTLPLHDTYQYQVPHNDFQSHFAQSSFGNTEYDDDESVSEYEEDEHDFVDSEFIRDDIYLE